MSGDLSKLTIDIRPGDRLSIDGGRIQVDLLEKSGKVARLRVVAPRDMKIQREECDQSRAMCGAHHVGT